MQKTETHRKRPPSSKYKAQRPRFESRLFWLALPLSNKQTGAKLQVSRTVDKYDRSVLRKD